MRVETLGKKGNEILQVLNMGRKWQCYFRINILPAINVDGGTC